MSDITLTTIESVRPDLLEQVLEQELASWKSELGWDYSLVSRILQAFIQRGALPGFAAVDGGKAVGYTYFLVHAAKGVIGTVYRASSDVPHEVVDRLQDAAVGSLQANPAVRRIEAQIMPFRGIELKAAFERRGFECHPRHFLELDLGSLGARRESHALESLVPLNSNRLEGVARVALLSYRDQIDAHLCADYCSEAGCLGFLRSLVETPGCGTFMPSASFQALDAFGLPCGFIIASRISATGAMIPQISILPAHQGRGVGKALMHASLHALAGQGCRTVALTVTEANQRAYLWYLRLGFRLRKPFAAYLWRRDG